MMGRDATSATSAGTHLRGRWLLLARVGWVAVAALALAIFVASLPGAYALSETLCHTVGCSNNDQLTSAALKQLRGVNLSLAFFAGYVVGLKSVTMLVFMAAAAVIFWRASADRVALVAAFTFVMFPLTATHLASTVPAAWVLPAQILDVLGSSGMTLLFLTFPNG
ncbi:MAG TPA: hypothetical protein VGR57_06875, partial [Ktedonobacterales bacterium]|nr:hypothetical protein [Ktedonobacterales bacterium]